MYVFKETNSNLYLSGFSDGRRKLTNNIEEAHIFKRPERADPHVDRWDRPFNLRDVQLNFVPVKLQVREVKNIIDRGE